MHDVAGAIEVLGFFALIGWIFWLAYKAGGEDHK